MSLTVHHLIFTATAATPVALAAHSGPGPYAAQFPTRFGTGLAPTKAPPLRRLPAVQPLPGGGARRADAQRRRKRQ